MLRGTEKGIAKTTAGPHKGLVAAGVRDDLACLIGEIMIKIWSPRWHDRVVLIAKYKVKETNEIEFTKTPSLDGTYKLSGETIRSYPLETNGKIPCYAVPLDVVLGTEND